MSNSKLVVLWAVFGAEQGSADVTQKVQQEMRKLEDAGKPLILKVKHELLGDPAKGYGKHFAIGYNYDGFNMSTACKEGQSLDLTKTNPINIIGAAYGSKEGSYDVTSEVANLVSHQGITKFKPKSVFEDPAKGHAKHFGVIYTLNGEKKTLACKDDQTAVLD